MLKVINIYLIVYNMKHILLCTWIYPPDIWWPASYVPKIAKKMVQDGIAPVVITYSDVAEDKQYDHLGFKVIRVKRSKIFFRSYIKYFFSVLKYAKKSDLIYLQDYFSAGIPTFLANIFLRKNIVTKIVWIFSREQAMNKNMTKDLLDTYVCTRQNFLLQIIKYMERFFIKRSNRIIVPSNYMKDLLVKFGMWADMIQVIYNSFDPIAYDIIDKQSKKQQLWIGDKKVYISVWRLVERKNFGKLIHAFQKISDGVLYIIWDGPLKHHLQKIIDKTHQNDKIFLLWSLKKNDLYIYYQIADIFVLISTYEGMSHVLLEAIAMNLFIISSNIAPNVETLQWYEKKKIIDFSDIDLHINNSKLNNHSSFDMKKYNFDILYALLLKSLTDVVHKK